MTSYQLKKQLFINVGAAFKWTTPYLIQSPSLAQGESTNSGVTQTDHRPDCELSAALGLLVVLAALTV